MDIIAYKLEPPNNRNDCKVLVMFIFFFRPQSRLHLPHHLQLGYLQTKNLKHTSLENAYYHHFSLGLITFNR